MTDHARRKADHLDLCATQDVGFRERTTLLEDVGLVHDALPELDANAIDTSTALLGRRLRAPIVIAAMTGGIPRAEAVNRDLAALADARGLAFGFGSMRPMLEQGVTDGYLVRDVAPNALLLANLGAVAARRAEPGQIRELIRRTGCDALALHLNAAQERVQAGGDEDFRGCLDAVARCVDTVGVPVLVKETGAGLSRSVATRLLRAGVAALDVGGAGGTSWVGVETLRDRARSHALGERFWDWGIPTAASLARLSGLPVELVATGGLGHGLDVARAVALGARAAGMARPLLVAHSTAGREGVERVLDDVLDALRTAMLLTGSADVDALARAPIHIGAGLASWVVDGTPLADRVAAFREGRAG
jgi:isopentenyl-diphosphate delta-isomerase